MYVGTLNLGALAGSGPGEFKGGVWTQALVDDRWAAIGQKPPAPLVPASLIGWITAASRGPRMLKASPSANIPLLQQIKLGINKNGMRGVTREENDFLNFFLKVAADPYRKQSGISKVAGGLLQVASVAIPAFGYFQAVATVGNAALAKGKEGGEAKLAERVMGPAIDQYIAKENATAKTLEAEKQRVFDEQLKSLQSATLPSPTSFAPAPSSASAAQIQLPTATTPVAQKYFGLSQNEILVAALGLLGVALIARSRS